MTDTARRRSETTDKRKIQKAFRFLEKAGYNTGTATGVPGKGYRWGFQAINTTRYKAKMVKGGDYLGNLPLTNITIVYDPAVKPFQREMLHDQPLELRTIFPLNWTRNEEDEIKVCELTADALGQAGIEYRYSGYKFMPIVYGNLPIDPMEHALDWREEDDVRLRLIQPLLPAERHFSTDQEIISLVQMFGTAGVAAILPKRLILGHLIQLQQDHIHISTRELAEKGLPANEPHPSMYAELATWRDDWTQEELHAVIKAVQGHGALGDNIERAMRHRLAQLESNE